MNENNQVIIVIPSYNPDEKLLQVVSGIIKSGFNDIIVVDDGSDDQHKSPFIEINTYKQCQVLTHKINKGKGRALKTAFSFIVENRKDILGIITVDGDNQHAVEDILHCKEELIKNPEKVILGCRDFSLSHVPTKNRMGNRITSLVFKFACGLTISDTQTGLRAIPYSCLSRFVEIDGERFEYETNMLLKLKDLEIDIKEVRINTIYIDENKTSHFNPIRDSFKVYLVIIKFMISSLLSALIDLGTFSLLIFLINNHLQQSERILIATLSARVISSLFNFICNRNAVFKAKGSIKNSFVKYYLLCLCQMFVSYGGVYLLSVLFKANNIMEIICKIIVDIILFCISFQIQRRWVFRR